MRLCERLKGARKMDGISVARIIDAELASRGISKADFYAGSGVSSATLSQWRTGKYDPTNDKLDKVEKFLGIRFADYEKSEMDDDTAELLESVRNRQDLKMLFHSARDLPPSSVYEVLAEIERRKENSDY